VKTWLASQTFDVSTRNSVTWRLNAQILPFFRARQLGAIRPTEVRAWIRSMQERNVATSYQAGCFAHLSSILSVAVDDKLIRENPCHARTVVRPRPVPPTIVPWSRARIAAMGFAMADRYKIVMVLGAGCGLRQGELFGISLDDIDREAGVLHVVRQVRVVDGRQVFSLPKRNKTRDVPLARSALRLVDEHLGRFEPVAVTLPWRIPSGEPTTVRLLLTDEGGRPMWRNRFQRPHLESCAEGGRRREACPAGRHARAAPSLRLGAARRGGERQGAVRVPRTPRSRFHPCAPTRTSCPTARSGLGALSMACSAAQRSATAQTRPTRVCGGSDLRRELYPAYRPTRPPHPIYLPEFGPHHLPKLVSPNRPTSGSTLT
jgi:integrase